MSYNNDNRYSRQELVYGQDSNKSLKNNIVMIIGCNPLGAEIGKNLVLSGISIILLDNQVINKEDILNSYFFNDNDLGKVRSEILYNKLQKLNPSLKISYISNFIESDKVINDEEYIISQILENKPNIVIVADKSYEEIGRYNVECRKIKSKVIASQVMGVSGFVFNDFGTKFQIKDIDGENYSTFQIKSINDEGIVETLSNSVHNMIESDTNKVQLSNLIGENIEFLSEQIWDIEVLSKNKFKLINFQAPKENFSLDNGIGIKFL